MDKKEQRQEIRNRLKTLKDKDYLDEQIYNNLVLLNILKGNVLVYNSINGEVSTKKIVENFKNKVSIYMPKVIGDDMVFVKIDDNTSFKEGAFSILEPVGKEYTKDEISFDVCITPLLGYDENLNRLGKGKGYYDRFFENNNCIKVGLAYSIQKLDKVVCEKNDIKLDYIVSELGVISESN